MFDESEPGAAEARRGNSSQPNAEDGVSDERYAEIRAARLLYLEDEITEVTERIRSIVAGLGGLRDFLKDLMDEHSELTENPDIKLD